MGVEALCSSTFFGSNIAASAPSSLPFPVAVDLGYSDEGISRRVKRSLRVAASRARSRSIVPAGSKCGLSVATSPVGSCLGGSSSRRSESCICRASSDSREREDGEQWLERENQSMDAGKKGITLEKVVAEDGRFQSSSSAVGLNFGSSYSEDEGFRRSPLPDFEDEFFARMMALEASPLSSSRASSTSTAAFFEGESTLSAGCDPPRPSSGQGVNELPGDSKAAATTPTSGRGEQMLCALGMGGVQLPPSIKKLRRRKNEVKGGSAFVRSARESGCAIKRAFSSMVYMIKAVQSHALQIRQVLFSDKWDVQQVLHLVEREMHSSFVWLFQRVFACTPTLMVSVMILLANFTVFSMGENVVIATVTETPTAIAHILSTYGNPQVSSLGPKIVFTSLPGGLSRDSTVSPLLGAGHGDGGKNNFPSTPIAEGFDGDSWLNGLEPNRRYGYSEKESSTTRNLSPPLQFEAGGLGVDMAKERPSHQEMVKAWVESSMKNQLQLEQETTQRLVAPVVEHLESDKYACFDRTDLEYQHALAKDPSSAVLLANFAQFLFVVRRDNHRAEQYFHRAMEADPQDSTILGRFANFLWLGRGNRSAAERAYKAAMAAEPESSYPAGSYAHFLWHSGDEDTHSRVA